MYKLRGKKLATDCHWWCLFTEIELQQIRRPDQKVVAGVARAIGRRGQGTAATEFRKFIVRAWLLNNNITSNKMNFSVNNLNRSQDKRENYRFNLQ